MPEPTRNVEDVILSTIDAFLDTCPSLEGLDIQVGAPFDFDAMPGGRRSEVTVDGVLYAVTVEKCND